MSWFSQNVPVSQPSFDAAAPFADPFADLASVSMPISVPAMLRYAEFFAISNSTMREAFGRIAGYFLTEVDVEGDLGDDEKKKQKDYLEREAGVIDFLQEFGLTFLVYGNAYLSVFKPFTRYVACPKCPAQYRFADEFSAKKEFAFAWKSGIHGRCPACGFSGCFHDKDTPPVDVEDDSRPLVLRSWNPHDIRIVYNEATGQSAAYDWVIPADFRTDVRLGYNKPVLADTPWPWLVAAMHDENVRFKPDHLFHWREPALAGLRFRGVGVPRAIVNFRQIFYCQILNRMNEVLALGHVVPMRVISPANTAGRPGFEETDILKSGYLGDFRSRVMRMVTGWRADPSSVHVSPIPLQMQALGADARNLIPQDILNQGLEVLLNGLGIPVEFYRLSLNTQTAPVALRLIKRCWAPFVHGLNRALRFVGRRAEFLLSWSHAEYSLTEVTVEDSVELAQLRLQASQAGLLSRTTAAKQLNADFAAEVKQKAVDNMTEQKVMADFQKDMDAFSFSGQLAEAGGLPGVGGPAGAGQPQPGQAPGAPGQPGATPAGQGQPPAGGAQQAAGMPVGQDPLQSLVPQEGVKIDPTEFLSRAQQTAQYLLSRPESERFGLLKRIRESNSMFHSLVKAQLEELRSDARSKGQQFMLQQQFGGGQQQGGQ